MAMEDSRWRTYDTSGWPRSRTLMRRTIRESATPHPETVLQIPGITIQTTSRHRMVLGVRRARPRNSVDRRYLLDLFFVIIFAEGYRPCCLPAADHPTAATSTPNSPAMRRQACFS